MRYYDWTMLSTLARCEQEFLVRYGPRALNEAPSAAQRYGQAVHEGVALHYAGVSADAVRVGMEIFWGADPSSGDPKRPALHLTNAHALVALWAREFPPVPAQVLCNERYLEHPTEPWCGILDRLVRNEEGRLVLRDTKTSSQVYSEAWRGQWAYSGQLALYWDLAEACFGEPVVEAWVEALGTSTRKEGPRKEDVWRLGPFTYSAGMRAALRERRWRLWERAEELLDGRGAPPTREPSACLRYNSLCFLHRFCRLEPTEFTEALNLATALGDVARRPWVPKERA